MFTCFIPKTTLSAAAIFACLFFIVSTSSSADDQRPPLVRSVEGQPLAAHAARILEALDFLGAPLPQDATQQLRQAISDRDVLKIQSLLDDHVLFVVAVDQKQTKTQQGPAPPKLQQSGFSPMLVKIINPHSVTGRLHIRSPQAGPLYSGVSLATLQRQAQTQLVRKEDQKPNQGQGVKNLKDRFLEIEMFRSPPLAKSLTGLETQYALALIYSSRAGKQSASIRFEMSRKKENKDSDKLVPGKPAQMALDVQPAIPVKLSIRDFDGAPTTARLTIRDKQGRVYPPQVKRLAPDFFFQPHIYRRDGEVVLLPPGQFLMQSTRGPEFKTGRQTIKVTASASAAAQVNLKRWIHPLEYGYFSGDHHIHGAGCSHYDNPTQGVTPKDMFRQVKGEGLNVGCVLTWGPCFDYQRRFFSPQADEVSQPLCLLKYDLEISGFGSAALGHVCLLNLANQTYPGSEGTSSKGWPSWTVPVMRWAKEQGGVTGYPHSAVHVDIEGGTKFLLKRFDENQDEMLQKDEIKIGVLPEPFDNIDADGDQRLTQNELEASLNRAADQLPNLAPPAMNGAGAMEIFVSTAEGVCDFISAMDTARVSEWNTWYHLLNCGFPLKLSGETDFPCMSGRRVGQGRVYVQLGEQNRLDFSAWCQALGQGRSYVSDGYAHALEFSVEGITPGRQDVALTKPQTVTARAKVAFAAEIPKAVAYGVLDPPQGRRMAGDTIHLHAPRSEEIVRGGKRKVEIVINGQPAVETLVPADGKVHKLEFKLPIERSSWIALRQFPQLHTNPVNVVVGSEPIRVSRSSALWCVQAIDLLWKNRNRFIKETEKKEAHETYQKAIAKYRQIAEEAPEGS